MANDDPNSQMAFDVTHGGRPHHVNTNADAPDPSVQSGLDAFFQSMCGSYHTPTGVVVVPTPFMMGRGYLDQRKFKANNDNKRAMARLAVTAGISQTALDRVQQARGTPDEIHALTQALIDLQPDGMAVDDPVTSVSQPDDVRKLMHQHAIGIDCAGYVQQAYLLATGRTRAQVGFVPNILNEALFVLPQRGFARFTSVAALRPGDIIEFNSPPDSDEPGHRTIVFDQRVATDDHMNAILAADRGPDFVGKATVRVLEMDSSYGSGGYYRAGGVQRQTWIFNETSQQWAYLHLVDAWDTGSDPKRWAVDRIGALYAPDVLDGFYRRRGR